ncbi:structural maintenance of chromosome protein 3 [Basidiobolus meristosporus CBS 931.73]|uniref:Structural maintenance of chromosomes protein n=1 Tax=Basidiobolus meristosporus CBS 931.73 TaxID=1314790 RepID=A0A1Y1Y040_9FUNG|nr:structural maintenance of chromosome protein 3 [Basidiobolus meristosporus CBS 931.73]|eukprot:ORX91367.1 structural maintenance of chromosome protein 3 [Basidiobolus meristosporus CBS 931.73]
MHIKQIIIQGFKSYKDQTVIEPFSSRHNVIVGRNGSGKSNFFAAIRFVLSDAYTNMGREERQALLHEGTGPATMSAYVEIIFDNTDNRFPTGREEVVLRRTIGLKKDEYSLDKKSASKSDVMNLLESAGFSRSNPYYIVPQGRVTSLTHAKDNERLQLLKEVAGTRVYETRRQESLKIMEETDLKRRKIEELLAYIEERLGELEEEKEELRNFQELDRERRCLEYTIYQREQNEIGEALEEIEEDRRREVLGSNQKRERYNQREHEISETENSIRELQQKIDLLTLEKQQLLEDKQEQVKILANIEMTVSDLEGDLSSDAGLQQRLSQELERISRSINEKEQELTRVTPEYESAARTESELKESLEKNELQLQALYAKQGRSTQFTSKAQRDRWLRKEIGEIQNTLSVQTSQTTELESEIQSLNDRKVFIENECQVIRDRLDQRKSNLDALSAEINQLKAQRDEQTDKRKELWREDAKFDSVVSNCREELRRNERTLTSAMDKNTSSGLEAIKRIKDRLNLSGVYGPLYELFDVDDTFRTAVEVTAGGSLFHVVVDTDETATKVLEALNRERVGRVTFMPLNRLKPKVPRYPESNDAIPMIQKLSFDNRYLKAIQQVFGKAIICPNLEVASKYSRSHNLNAITLEGDRVDRKGALTGGYHDTRRSRLETIKTIKSLKSKFASDESRAVQVKDEISKMDQDITQILSRIQLSEAKRRQLQDSREPLELELSSKNKEVVNIKQALDQKQKALYSLQSSVRGLSSQLETYQAELGTALSTRLSAQEQRTLENLVRLTKQIKEDLVRAASTRTELETRRNILESELNVNLKRRYSELSAKIESMVGGDSDQLLDTKRQQLITTRRNISEVTSRLQDIEKELDEFISETRELGSKLENIKSEQLDDARSIQRQQKNVEKYLAKRTLLLQKKEECTKNIRELGVLPEEAFEKYQETGSQKLLKKLHKVNEGLKKYAHVNKKAFEQYNNFTKQRDALIKRKDELDTSANAIQDLIDVLDQRKDEAIERTFKQVAKYFAEIFEKLVPLGRGQLIMQRRIDREQGEDDEEEVERGIIDNYTGIAIKVSFNSKTDEGLRMQQLSGGQKSLVALGLIFAIQQCDPAPFYLFDEIDANLDAVYRTAVASMIHELSETAQFITTTFRPEMLANSDKFYGVTFTNKVSRVNCITKEDALNFVEQEHAQ